MTDDSSSGVAPIGDGGAPNTDPDLIMGVSIFGASCLALSSRLWSPGSTAKSAQPLVISLSSSRTIMIVSPGPATQPLRTIPTCSLGSGAPSYICRGLGLRAQPMAKSPVRMRHALHDRWDDNSKNPGSGRALIPSYLHLENTVFPACSARASPSQARFPHHSCCRRISLSPREIIPPAWGGSEC